MGLWDKWYGSNCTFNDIVQLIEDKEIQELLGIVIASASIIDDYDVIYEFIPNSLYNICFYKNDPSNSNFKEIYCTLSFTIHPSKKYLKTIDYSSWGDKTVKSGVTFDFMAPVKALQKCIFGGLKE